MLLWLSRTVVQATLITYQFHHNQGQETKVITTAQHNTLNVYHLVCTKGTHLKHRWTTIYIFRSIKHRNIYVLQLKPQIFGNPDWNFKDEAKEIILSK